MTIQHMRKVYARDGLNEKEVDPDPVVQFQRWFHEANQPDTPDWLEVNAMTLSTADSRGAVTSRIVLLKGIEEGKFLFFTNYESTKGKQMAQNPQVSICFFWPHLERQVRIEGRVSKTDRARSTEYAQSRPRDSQLGAHVSEQSSVIENRAVLERQKVQLEKQYEGKDIPCPEHWGGYEVHPEHIEFWQGRTGRLHDRIVYQRQECDRWQIVRLSP